MHRACVAAIAVASCGCCAYSYDVADSPRLAVAEPTQPPTWGPLPLDPSPELRVWIGVPPAVVTPIPTSRWPEHEPQSLPWETAIWVPEHYDWDWEGGTGWQWLRGRWITPPGPGYEWNPPTYVHAGYGSYFVAGFFCPPTEPVECSACDSRRDLLRSRLACSPGLSRERKLELARHAAAGETFLVSR